MDGYYETTIIPKNQLPIWISGLAIWISKKHLKHSIPFKKLLLLPRNMVGSFSTTFKMKTELDQHLNPVYDSLYAFARLVDDPQSRIHDVKLFNKAADVLKYSNLHNPTIQNVNIKFEVKNGRVTTQPFDMNVAGQKIDLSGSTGLDQTIDYTGKIAIPRSALGTP
jgi:hypothetical protein